MFIVRNDIKPQIVISWLSYGSVIGVKLAVVVVGTLSSNNGVQASLWL